MTKDATIAALATAPLPAGVAILRLSGPDALLIASRIFEARRKPDEYPRELVFSTFLDPHEGQTIIDRGYVVYLPGPSTYTGEDVVELHIHGGQFVSRRLLEVLFYAGAQPAEPGEFTKRAFLNGKLDLAQAEAVLDVVHASSEASLRAANEQLTGKLSNVVDDLGEPLRDAAAELEASIDFPDEDIEPKKRAQISDALQVVMQRLAALEQSYSYGHFVREGCRVLLCGPPNVGKSSLLNRIVGFDRAIVTEEAGTTRDLIEEQITHQGIQFVICDSAGLREETAGVEKIGIELAQQKLKWADLILWVVDANNHKSLAPLISHIEPQRPECTWIVVNKIDECCRSAAERESSLVSLPVIWLSAKTGEGIDFLFNRMVHFVEQQRSDAAEGSALVTSERHRACIHRARSALSHAVHAISNAMPEEIACAELRASLTALNEIVGKTHTEDLLGRIFNKFCIGK